MQRISDCADLINARYSAYTLLDVGCRTKALKDHIAGCKLYQGLDMEAGDEVEACDLENGIPFGDREFDIVTALDVVEHVDNAHKLVQEMRRVARSAVFISLPNMYYISFRWNFLRGRGISGKYPFPPTQPADRHKWLPSYLDAIEFVRAAFPGWTVDVHKVMPARGRLRRFVPVERRLAERYPNLLVYGSLFHIHRPQ